eukprot:305257-Prymnesium_polylepis.1
MKQGKLLQGFPTWKQQTYAARIMKMNLSPLERDTLAFTIRQFKRYGNEGNVWHRRGNFLFAVQMVAAAVVPVLIGLLGSFDSDFLDLVIRLIAILLSVTGTFCNVVESVYQFRERGQRRKTFADSRKWSPDALHAITNTHRPCSPCGNAHGRADALPCALPRSCLQTSRTSRRCRRRHSTGILQWTLSWTLLRARGIERKGSASRISQKSPSPCCKRTLAIDGSCSRHWSGTDAG